MRAHEVWHDEVVSRSVIDHLTENAHENIHRSVLRAWCIEKFTAHASVLEVGCGPGLVGKELSNYFDYTGVDNSQCMLDYVRHTQPQLNITYGDAYNLNFPDNSYDYAVCFAVLGHLPVDSIHEPIAELCRVARNTVLLTVWSEDNVDAGNALHNGYSKDYLTEQTPAWATLHFEKDFGNTIVGYRIDCRA